MSNPQHARDLAKFLAPALDNARDITGEPSSPDSCPCHGMVIDPTRPSVDFAVHLELNDAWRKGRPAQGGATEQGRGKLTGHLTEVLERDDHAVGVLWALLADRGDQWQADALPQPLASPPGVRSTPGGNGRSIHLPHKAASGLRRVSAYMC